ncbi:hypothetical protein [Sorangium sp. So ce1099]|uniref:hypothetical protein n=1 Tax=Sorangium sp. So ce1099 TaxID=3133331 RepID=UPI003F5EA953
MKLGIVAFEALKSALGEGRERLADLTAEVREEMARQQQGADASSGVRVEMEPPAS